MILQIKLSYSKFILMVPALMAGLTAQAAADKTQPPRPPVENFARPPAAIAIDTPPDAAKPPLSEQEIFPHLDLPDKKGEQPAPPPANILAPPGEEPLLSAAQKRRAEEDKLFAELKRSADFTKAAALSRAIEGLWEQSGSDNVDLLMLWANQAIAAKNYNIALDFLDNIVALAPNYAEGWLRRASVHLMTDNIALAMVEMQRVLQLEPRHYNALLQLGAVMEMTGRTAEAQRAYEQALEFYPQMRSAQKRIQALAEKDSGRAI